MKVFLLLAISLSLKSMAFTNKESCNEKSSIDAINNLQKGLKPYYSESTIQTAKAIINIGRSCIFSNVKVQAALVLRKALDPYYYETLSPVAYHMGEKDNLCGADPYCAKQAINSLSRGVYPYYTDSTLIAIDEIEFIFKQSPYESVKDEALTALSKCTDPYYEETAIRCAKALSEIAQCKLIK